VCPTCYCFDVRDEMQTDLKTGERVRVWDACTLEDFSKVAGGHSFRSSRSARLRHRFNRKFNYLADRFDALFCVGCGRCSRTCLVEINIAKVTNELIRESAKD
jgi:sulfhydrogenase subunit beta (sulfur reductase)